MEGWVSPLSVGGSFTAKCIAAKTGPKPTSFEWFKDKTKVTSGGTNGEEFKITSAKSTDAGVYTCNAINADGATESAPSTLLIKGKC